MIGLPYLNDLFTNILTSSLAIGGRLIYCARMGPEINFEEFDQVITQSFEGRGPKTYPVALLMPPLIRGDFTTEDWERYQITMFFLTSSFYDSTGTKDANPDTATSTHTLLGDSHDMIRSAKDFIAVLEQVSRERRLIQSSIRLGGRNERAITPVHLIGVDRLSGARLDFAVTLFTACRVEDYTADGIAEIVIPEEDSHPQH